MVSIRKTYTREFKIETVKLITDGGGHVPEIARDMAIHPNTLYNWIQQFLAKPEETFPGKGNVTSDAEIIRQLKRENERLKKEREILNKSNGHFFERPELIFPFICHLQTEFPVSVMCRTFNVSRSGYYTWLRRPDGQRKTADKALAKVIKEIHEESGREYRTLNEADQLKLAA